MARIENTISAAEGAIARGFLIELDVQLTADNEAIVFHDFELDRLTGQKGAVERTLADLTTIDIAGTKRVDRIPSFRQFLDAVAGRVPLVIEIKSRFNGDVRLTKRVCEILADYSGPFVVKSFDPFVVSTPRTSAPSITRGIIGEVHYASKNDSFMSAELKHRLGEPAAFRGIAPQFVSWKVDDLPCAGPYLCKVLGNLPVMTWTVRNPDQRARAEKFADQMVFEGFVLSAETCAISPRP